MYSMYFVFSYFICPVYCSIDTNACQYVRIKKLYILKKKSFKTKIVNTPPFPTPQARVQGWGPGPP